MSRPTPRPVSAFLAAAINIAMTISTAPPAAPVPSADASTLNWIVQATALFSDGSKTHRRLIGHYSFRTREEARRFFREWRHPYVVLLRPRRLPRQPA